MTTLGSSHSFRCWQGCPMSQSPVKLVRDGVTAVMCVVYARLDWVSRLMCTRCRGEDPLSQL